MNGKVFHDSQYKLFVGAFSNYGGTKNSVSLTDSEVQTFLEGEKNQYTKRKTESYKALVLEFLSAENKIRQLEDLPLTDFGRLPERLLL